MQPDRIPPDESATTSRTSTIAKREAPLPFTLEGVYEVTRRLGGGGMGDVFLAYDRGLKRKVAVKVLPADLARSPEFVRRFKAEATAAAKLVHPNIIRIHRIGEDAGRHFFVMDFIEGESLAALLSRRTSLAVPEALAIVEHVLKGLSAAHEQGMVHRDVKPGNILLDPHNRLALLADFGLAKSLESSSTRMTATGVVLGTLDYLSPEQGRGEPPDARSDLYSTGILLYQMLSGRLPFRADNPMALIFQHVHEAPPPLAQAAPQVPAAAVALVERLLAKSPADRYQTAADALQALRTAQRQSSAARPAGTARELAASECDAAPLHSSLFERPPHRWYERMQVLVLQKPRRALAVLAAAVMLAIALAGLALWRNPEAAPADASGAEPEAVGDYKGNALLVTDVNPRALARFSTSGSDLVTIRPSRDGRLITLARIDGTIQLAEVASGQVVKSVATSSDFSAGLAVSPSGHAAATVAQEPPGAGPWLLKVWNLRENDPGTTVASLSSPTKPLTISDDRRVLSALLMDATSCQIVRWNAAEGTEIDRQQLPPGEPGASLASPDGSWLAVVRGTGEITVGHRAEIGKPVAWRSLAAEGTPLALNAERGWLATALANGTATLWDLEHERAAAELSGQGAPIRAMSFDASGRRLAVVTDRNVRVWDLGLDYVRVVCPVDEARAAAFDTEGARLITGSGRGEIGIWNSEFQSLWVDVHGWLKKLGQSLDASEFKTTVEAKLPKPEHYDPHIAISRDGRLRAVVPRDAVHRGADGTMVPNSPDIDFKNRVEDAATSEMLHDFGGLIDQTCVAISADGQLAATGGWGDPSGARTGILRLWDLRSGTELQRSALLVGIVHSVAFSPDGSRVLAGGDKILHVWDLRGEREVRQIRVRFPYINRVAFSPDGRLAVAALCGPGGQGQQSALYDLATGTELLEHSGPQPEIVFASRDLLFDTRFGILKRLQPANETPAFDSEKIAAALKAARETKQRAAAVADAFVRAHAIVYRKQDAAGDVATTLQSVAADLPRLTLCTKPGEVVWNHVEMNPKPARFAAYVFESPLDEPADLYWLYTCREFPLNWYIVPAEGTMQGFTGYDRLTHPHYQDLAVPVHDYAFCQSLTGGQILPGKAYILWFAQQQSQDEERMAELAERRNDPAAGLNDAQKAAIDAVIKHVRDNPKQDGAPLSMALRLVPSASTPPKSQALGIAEQIGPLFFQSSAGRILYQRDQPLLGICVTPTGREIAICDGTNTIRLWSREKSVIDREFMGDRKYSWAVASADGKRLAAGTWRSMHVSLWDLDNGERLAGLGIGWTEEAQRQLREMVGGYEDWVGSDLVFHDGSQRVMAHLYSVGQVPGVGPHHAVLWDLQQNKEIHRLALPASSTDGWLVGGDRELLLMQRGPPDGQRLRETEIARLDWETGKQLSSIPLGARPTWGRLLLSPDQKRVGVCITRSTGNTYEIYDLESGKLVVSLGTTVTGETMTNTTVQVAAWSDDSRLLALGFADASIRVWDVSEGRLLQAFRGHIQELRALAFAPDGKTLFSSSDDGTVRQWALDYPVRDSLTDSLGIALVPIAPGEFVMGTYAGYKDQWGYRMTNYQLEQPQHRVRISRQFYMGRHEVTVGQFRRFVEATGYKTTAETTGKGSHMLDSKVGLVEKPEYTWRSPGFPQTDDHPVVQVSWLDAQAFCDWLSKQEHAVYRLPTEAEWEYACRAGHEREMWNSRPLSGPLRGEDTYGNIADASIRRQYGQYQVAFPHDDTYVFTAPVGKCNLNDFGLYDMHGNVFEWCSDWHDPVYYRISPEVDPQGPRGGTNRVQRGGGFFNHADCSRSSYRDLGHPEQTQSSLGFRVVREIEPAE